LSYNNNDANVGLMTLIRLDCRKSMTPRSVNDGNLPSKQPIISQYLRSLYCCVKKLFFSLCLCSFDLFAAGNRSEQQILRSN